MEDVEKRLREQMAQLLERSGDSPARSTEAAAQYTVAAGLFAIAAELNKANQIAEGRLIEAQMARRDG